ncbi:MAG TPA: cytochrome P450 [Acidimicrobiales bacterium]
MLRYDSPVQLTARYALADAEVGGVIIPEGSFVLLLIGVANRDPDLCVDPDSLDVGRPPSHDLAFGQGIHFCLGAPLARLEAQIALSAVVQSGSELRLASEPEWKENSVLRGLRRLVVTVS